MTNESVQAVGNSVENILNSMSPELLEAILHTIDMEMNRLNVTITIIGGIGSIIGAVIGFLLVRLFNNMQKKVEDIEEGLGDLKEGQARAEGNVAASIANAIITHSNTCNAHEDIVDLHKKCNSIQNELTTLRASHDVQVGMHNDKLRKAYHGQGDGELPTVAES